MSAARPDTSHEMTAEVANQASSDGDRWVIDLPARDPGLPRFAVLLVFLAVLGATSALFDAGRPRAARPGQAAAPSAPVTPASGAVLFVSAGCASCHPTVGASTPLGPSLAGARSLASQRISAADYEGTATTPEQYLAEATVSHCLDVVPGYSCEGIADYGLVLTADEVDRLVQFMMGLP